MSLRSVPAGDRPEHVDAVVVGSGFGGSVSAYRLAEAGLRVVVLERGRAYPPGSFARTPRQMSGNLWDPSEGLYGLFDVWTFNGFDSVVSSGLGGGSLIYANVLLRKDERWFVTKEKLPKGAGYETWPVTRQDLEPHYDAVEKMLGATRYPLPAARPRLRRHPQDAGHAGRGQGPGPELGAAAARGQLRAGTGGGARARAADQGSRVRQPAQGGTADLPVVRGVRHRLQRRGPRTRSTTRTCRRPRRPRPAFAPTARHAAWAPATAVATRSPTSSTTRPGRAAASTHAGCRSAGSPVTC